MRRFKRLKKYRAVLALILVLATAVGQSNVVEAVRSITQINNDKNNIKNQIEELDEELYQVVLEVQEMASAIEETQMEIEETKLQQQAAEEAINQQYADMKLRIKYMYEAEDPSVFELLIESGSISEFLNKLEYINAVYDYDRDKMDQYVAAKAELDELELALEEQEAELESQKAALKTRQANLDATIAKKKDKLKDLDKELAEAKRIAAERAAAARRANAANLSNNKNFNVGGDLNPAQKTSISGSSVVSYANQFVGNRYVWGGTSLTNGCDCSGFVMGVYSNFGISFGGRITSGGLRSVGQEVSYKYMQPGDIVCYAGHVAIYQGNGTIVEAQSAATGITNNRSVNCHSIITIRRVI